MIRKYRQLPNFMLAMALAAFSGLCESGAEVFSESRCLPLLTALSNDEIVSVNGLYITDDCKTVFVSTRSVNFANEDQVVIASYTLRGDQWSGPEPVFEHHAFSDYQPTLSPDETWLFFTSTRPTGDGEEPVRQNVWYSQKSTSGKWGKPAVVEALVSEGWDGHAMLTESGTLYYASERAKDDAMLDIYRADFANGSATNLMREKALNSRHSDNDLYVDPAERFLILTRYDPEKKDLNLFISQNKDDAWSTPRPVPGASGPDWELSPTVTPDGKTLIFQKGKKGKFTLLPLGSILQLE